MSIVIHITYSGRNGSALRFAQEMCASGIVNQIRAEEGNLAYAYYQPLHDPESILLIDKWASQTALDKHHASPMMQQIIALREKYDLHMHVERFLSDDGDIPEGDRGFIRE